MAREITYHPPGRKSAGWRAALGPGLLLAAAAIGVSHLVQATRAGADYGFGLLWIVLLVNLFKYPFLEFGPRYAAATGESMLDGYYRLGRWALGIYLLFTVGTMFAIQAALALVTANLSIALTGVQWSPLAWAAIVLALSISILIRGRYGLLDATVKWIVALLALSTLLALFIAIGHGPVGNWSDTNTPSLWQGAGIAFVIALMGWMPIPIDAAAWHSLWTLERSRQTGWTPTLRQAQFDFNVGYIGTALLALGFLALGALVMHGSGVSFSNSGSEFAEQLIALYTATLGEWARPLIALCALTAMFSTTLTVLDAHPRVCRHMAARFLNRQSIADSVPIYRMLLIAIPTCSLGVLYGLGAQFTLVIDLATTLSFLTAPVLAWLNYKLVIGAHVPEYYRPGRGLRILSWGGMVFLTGFALVYIAWRIWG